MERYKVQCQDCGAVFTEVYPEGLDGGESYSDPSDPKPCDCPSEYALLTDPEERRAYYLVDLAEDPVRILFGPAGREACEAEMRGRGGGSVVSEGSLFLEGAVPAKKGRRGRR